MNKKQSTAYVLGQIAGSLKSSSSAKSKPAYNVKVERLATSAQPTPSETQKPRIQKQVACKRTSEKLVWLAGKQVGKLKSGFAGFVREYNKAKK